MKKNAPRSISMGDCVSENIQYYASQGRPGVKAESAPIRQTYAQRKAFYQALTSGLASAARAEKDRFRRARWSQEERAIRALSSAGPDARVEAAVRGRALARARAGKTEFTSLDFPKQVADLAPTPSVRNALRAGKRRPPHKRRDPGVAATLSSRVSANYKAHVDDWEKVLSRPLERLARTKKRRERSRENRLSRAKRDDRPTEAGWTSTGRLVSASRGPAFVWPGRTGPSSWAAAASLSYGQRLLGGAPELDAMWGVGVSVGALHLGGGGRLPLGTTRGGQVGIRWLGGPNADDAPLDPGVVWSAGLQLDWVSLQDQTSYSLRAPLEWNVPVLEWLSLDAGVDPDVLGLAALLGVETGLDTRAASSEIWGGATATAWQGRLALHARVGPGWSVSQFAPALWRVELQGRF